MKRISLYILLSFLFFNAASAKIIDFSCKGFKSYNSETRERDNNFEDYMHLRIDTGNKLIIEFADGGSVYANREWKITEIDERFFYSDDGVDMGSNNAFDEATLNRFTGEYFSTTGKAFSRYCYHCKQTKQLF